MTAIRLGAIYFILVFAVGFALGVARTLLLAPRLGETAAVLVELPLILLASWWVCARLLRGRRLGVAQALGMGAVAFVLLMLAEAALGMGLAGRSMAEHLAHYRSTPGLLGLGGQLAFAAFPLLQVRRGSSRA